MGLPGRASRTTRCSTRSPAVIRAHGLRRWGSRLGHGVAAVVGWAYGVGPGGEPEVIAWWSPDGRTWKTAPVDLGLGGQVFSVAATPSGFLATGPSGEPKLPGRHLGDGRRAGMGLRRRRIPHSTGFGPYAAAGSPTTEIAVGLTSAGGDSRTGSRVRSGGGRPFRDGRGPGHSYARGHNRSRDASQARLGPFHGVCLVRVLVLLISAIVVAGCSPDPSPSTAPQRSVAISQPSIDRPVAGPSASTAVPASPKPAVTPSRTTVPTTKPSAPSRLAWTKWGGRLSTGAGGSVAGVQEDRRRLRRVGNLREGERRRPAVRDVVLGRRSRLGTDACTLERSSRAPTGRNGRPLTRCPNRSAMATRSSSRSASSSTTRTPA